MYYAQVVELVFIYWYRGCVCVFGERRMGKDFIEMYGKILKE